MHKVTDDYDALIGPLKIRADKEKARKEKPKKAISVKPKQSEDELHYQVARLLSLAIARPGAVSPDKVIWWTIESRAKRSVYEGARNKRRGCIAGCPDIFVMHRGRAFWIELKTPTGKTSDAQIELHGSIVQAGSHVGVARSVNDILPLLWSWGVPYKRMTIG
jgi:hypothetical protein